MQYPRTLPSLKRPSASWNRRSFCTLVSDSAAAGSAFPRFHGRRAATAIYYLVRESDAPNVVTNHVPQQGYFSVDVLHSPVVQFNSCHFDGKILRRGRVYYVDGFYGEDGAWVVKSDGFRHWAKAVLKATKKLLSKRGGDYLGRDASIWLDRENGKLVT